jgi:hypothetical protein
MARLARDFLRRTFATSAHCSSRDCRRAITGGRSLRPLSQFEIFGLPWEEDQLCKFERKGREPSRKLESECPLLALSGHAARSEPGDLVTDTRADFSRAGLAGARAAWSALPRGGAVGQCTAWPRPRPLPSGMPGYAE